MKIRITIYSAFFALYAALRLLPSYFSNSVSDFLDNVFLVLAIAFLVLKKYKPSKFMILAVVYSMLMVLMSYINKTDRADYHLLVSNIKALVFLSVTECSVKRDTKRAINTLFYVLLLYVLTDFISILLFPYGLYIKETVWNEWSSSFHAQWIFGNKNNRIYWYICLILAGCWKRANAGNRKMDLVVALLCIMTGTAVIMVNSITSLVVAIIAILGVWLGVLSKKQTKLRIPAKLVYPVYALFSVFWISGTVSFLRVFVEKILGRDMSFTNRTIAWGRAILHILQKPLFGWGIMGEKATQILGSKMFVNAHNQILESLWQGGIVGFILFSAIIICTAGSISKVADKKKNLFLVLMLIAILVEMLAESVLGVDAVWIYLLLCYHFSAWYTSRGTRQNV